METSGPFSEQISAAVTPGGPVHFNILRIDTQEIDDAIVITITVNRGDRTKRGNFALLPTANLIRDLEAVATEIDQPLELARPILVV